MLIAVYIGVFSWRALAILHVHEKEYLRNTLAILSVLSAFFLLAIITASFEASKEEADDAAVAAAEARESKKKK